MNAIPAIWGRVGEGVARDDVAAARCSDEDVWLLDRGIHEQTVQILHEFGVAAWARRGIAAAKVGPVIDARSRHRRKAALREGVGVAGVLISSLQHNGGRAGSRATQVEPTFTVDVDDSVDGGAG
jgi:acyl-CoA reductase-like NAD-dependent aldehyde dehydrogenase